MAHDVHWDGRKWPDRLHWQFTMTRLGDDECGTWFAVPSGSRVQRAHEAAFDLPDGFVMVVPPDRWWSAEFYVSHPEWELYVNIGLPAEIGVDWVRQVDLDLDVVRTLEGALETLDEDEFADHQLQFEYPIKLIEGARRAEAEVVTMLERRDEPFERASKPWLALADEVLGPHRRLARD